MNMIPKLTWGYESFSFPYLNLFSQLSKQSCVYLEILVVKLFSLSGSNSKVIVLASKGEHGEPANVHECVCM